MADAVNLIRYDLVTNYRCGDAVEEMEQSADGDWVLWDLVEVEIARLQESIDILRPSAQQYNPMRKRAEAAAAREAQMREALKGLSEQWKARGRSMESQWHKAIRRGDDGAADIYDSEQRCLFACADELDAALAVGEARKHE